MSGESMTDERLLPVFTVAVVVLELDSFFAEADRWFDRSKIAEVAYWLEKLKIHTDLYPYAVGDGTYGSRKINLIIDTHLSVGLMEARNGWNFEMRLLPLGKDIIARSLCLGNTAAEHLNQIRDCTRSILAEHCGGEKS